MAISRRQAMERAERVLARPSSRMELKLYHGKRGLTLRHRGRVVTRTWDSTSGRKVAPFLAHALGVDLPAPGTSTTATISSGLLFRVLSISCLDLRRREGKRLLLRLLEEADHMRSLGEAPTLE